MKKGVFISVLFLLVFSLSSILAVYSSNQLTLQLNNGTATTGWTVRAMGDLNKDGIADIFWQNSTGNPAVWYMSSNGSLNSYAILSSSTALSSWYIRGVGDIDRDNVTDIIWQNSTGTAVVWFMYSNGTRKSYATIYLPATPWYIRGAGDIDKDGIADIIWQSSAGSAVVGFMYSNGSQKSSATISASTSWTIQAVGDTDKDGVADLIWQNSTGSAAIWILNSNGSKKSSKEIPQNTNSGKIISAGDIDKDGMVDLVLQFPSNNNATAIWFNSVWDIPYPTSLPSANCTYGSTCGPFQISHLLNFLEIKYGLAWKYVYNDGTSQIYYENVTPSNKYIDFNKNFQESPAGKIISTVKLYTSLIGVNSQTYYVEKANISLNYNCVHECQTYQSTNCSGELYSYKQCGHYNASNSCLQWSTPVSCASNEYCESSTNSCVTKQGASQCNAVDNRFCSLKSSVSNAFSTSFTCGISGVTCFECNSSKGFSLDPSTGLSCVNTNCIALSNYCGSKGGICSNQSLSNSAENSSLVCCDGSSSTKCYICGEGYHSYNENCVSNTCSNGIYPDNLTGVILGTDSASSGSNIWAYDITANNLSGCKWKCDIGYRKNDSTNNTCIVGTVNCATELNGICSASNIAGSYSISGTDCSGSCYICNASAGYGKSGNTCVLGTCDSGKTWNGVSCVDQGTCAGCIYSTNSCLVDGFRLNVAGIGNAYCEGTSHQFKAQKADGTSCVSASECINNFCNNGQCYNLINQIQTSNSLLNKIWCWIKSGFTNTSGTC